MDNLKSEIIFLAITDMQSLILLGGLFCIVCVFVYFMERAFHYPYGRRYVEPFHSTLPNNKRANYQSNPNPNPVQHGQINHHLTKQAFSQGVEYERKRRKRESFINIILLAAFLIAVVVFFGSQ